MPETQWELRPLPRGADGSDHFILKNLSNDHFLLLSSEECFLWRQLDGRNSLEEIARAFHLAYGAIDYAEIRAFLTKLYHAGFQIYGGYLGVESFAAPTALSFCQCLAPVRL